MAMQFSKEDQEKLKNDKSEIYRKRTEETNQEDIANLSRKGKLQHFKDYYLKSTLVIILVACIVVSGVVHAVTKRAVNALYIAIQYDAIPEEQIPAFQEAIEEYLELNTEDEIVTVNISCTDQQLQTYFYAGTADILITDEEHFKQWGQAEYFYASNKNKEVSFYLDYDEKYRYSTPYVTSEDVRTNMEIDDIKKATPTDETEYNCGLYLTDSEKYKQLGGAIEKPVLGIATTTNHLPEAKKFTKYMMDNSQKMTLEQPEPTEK